MPVKFTATAGYPATHYEPGEPDQIENITFDHAQAIDLINAELETSETEDALMAEAEESGKDWETERAEFKLTEQIERRSW